MITNTQYKQLVNMIKSLNEQVISLRLDMQNCNESSAHTMASFSETLNGFKDKIEDVELAVCELSEEIIGG